MENLFFVGPGRAGLALGHALWQADAVAELTYCGRRPEPPSHPLFMQGVARYVFGLQQPPLATSAVFLSVPDDVLAEMAHTLAGHGRAPAGCAAFHLSGALSTDVLAPLHHRGYSVGSVHPLQALAHPITGADRLRGSYFAVSGEPGAIRVARRLLRYLDAPMLTIPVSRRAVYHAAAVVAANYVPTLLALAGRLLVQAGVPEDKAVDALLPLARGALDNVEDLGLLEALTGPVTRGDVETIRLHLAAMEPREREVYRMLGRELVILARARGLEDDAAQELDELFQAGP
jgi:predicted short-subunit dehydrogenase-like oxidoreductase (DUF2520 family)